MIHSYQQVCSFNHNVKVTEYSLLTKVSACWPDPNWPAATNMYSRKGGFDSSKRSFYLSADLNVPPLSPHMYGYSHYHHTVKDYKLNMITICEF